MTSCLVDRLHVNYYPELTFYGGNFLPISFFTRYHRALIVGSCLYVLLLVLSHATLPQMHVWIIAMVFSIAMNFTYMIEARSIGNYFAPEATVAGILILLSVLGVLWHPLFVIIAIFSHGVWDLLKHSGAGVPFFRWFTINCFIVETSYSAVLLLYWMQ